MFSRLAAETATGTENFSSGGFFGPPALGPKARKLEPGPSPPWANKRVYPKYPPTATTAMTTIRIIETRTPFFIFASPKSSN
jgi:hypothetical protein